MAGKGRPNKYKTHVEPYLTEIKEMCLTMTEEQIAETLGVAYSSFRTYKQHYSALNEALKKGRQNLVTELRSALIKRAKGFEITETKKIYEYGCLERLEISTKYYPPDVAALNLALKNYDKDNWANDPQMIRIREKELELQEKKLEQGEWV